MTARTTSRRTQWSRGLALVLISIGLSGLIGCFYLPLPEKVVQGPDFRNKVGAPGSSRPLRPGSVTRAQVEAVLGKPVDVSPDGHEAGYSLHTLAGDSVYVLCFEAMPRHRYYLLRVTYDDGGMLRSYQAVTRETDEYPLMNDPHIYYLPVKVLDYFHGSPPGGVGKGADVERGPLHYREDALTRPTTD